MAIRGAVRWKPDAYRSSIEATVAELNPTGVQPPDAQGNPQPDSGVPGGSVVMIAQAVAYDDTIVTGANYQAGDPATERNIVVLHERTYTFDLSVAHTSTQAQIDTLLTNTLNSYRSWILPAGPALVRMFYSARRSAPILVG